MILYLSSNENIDLLDHLIEDKKLVIKKLSGQFNLNKFVIHDMRNLNHCTQIVIDLKAITDIEEEIINAFTAFKKIYNARITVIAEGFKQGSELLLNLIKIEIYNLVTANTIDEMKKEIEKCLVGDGMIYQDCLKYLLNEIGKQNTKQYSFKGENIKIIVTGVMPRIGTTTVAMNLANYLAGIGATVCYIETNESNHLRTLPLFYDELTTKEDYIEYKGVRYYYRNCNLDKDYNFIITDIGELTEKNIRILKSSDVNILCAGGKPYEIKKIYSIAETIEDIKADVCLSFTSQRGRIKIEKLMEELEKKYYFLGCSTDLFDGNANKEIYSRILEDYVEEKIQ